LKALGVLNGRPGTLSGWCHHHPAFKGQKFSGSAELTMKTISNKTRLAIAVCFTLIWTAWVCPKAADEAVPPSTTAGQVATKVPNPSTTRGPMSVTDQKLRERAQADRQRLLERAKARAEAQKIPLPNSLEGRHPELMRKYDANKNGRLDWWERDKYRADFERARAEKRKATVKPAGP